MTSATGQDHEALVIGAGVAGLSTAVELGRRGVGALVLDRADDVGSSWQGRYDGLRLNTYRRLSSPLHGRIPRSAGRWPRREALVEHLRDYARRERVEIEFGTAVERIDRAPGGYELESAAGPRTARFVVVATGHDHAPRIPEWPGSETFAGELLHARDYRSPAPFAARDVLVVGAGNTGTEIAVQLEAAGARRVRMAVRTPPNLVPIELYGLPITYLARVAELTPEPLVNLIGRGLRRYAVGDLTQFGLPPSPYGIGTELRVKGLGPVLDRGIGAAVRSGRVEVVAAVDSLEGADVRLADGERIRPDVVIAATGYRMGLEPLVGHLGVLLPTGKPRCVRGEADPAAPGLHFNGYWLPMSGELPAMRRTTRRIGAEITRFRAGRAIPRPAATAAAD
ncbi:MAG TPA: NAD(P)/FAD-dependent oxidoreductase [Solirubrobacterales bacterium]|jgi:putative flavoprotein involved in K+ transport